MQHIVPCVWFHSINIEVWNLSMLLNEAVACSSSLLCRFSLYDQTVTYLFIFCWWIVDCFWFRLLITMLLWTFLYISFEHLFTFLLGTYPGLELLGHRSACFVFSQCCQTIFQSVLQSKKIQFNFLKDRTQGEHKKLHYKWCYICTQRIISVYLKIHLFNIYWWSTYYVLQALKFWGSKGLKENLNM